MVNVSPIGHKGLNALRMACSPKQEKTVTQRVLLTRETIPSPSFGFLYFLLNILGWNWLTTSYRFQVHMSVIQHLHVASCGDHLVKSSVTIYLTPLTTHHLPFPLVTIFLNLPATCPGDQKLFPLLRIGNDFKYCHQLTGWSWPWPAALGATALELTSHGKQPATSAFFNRSGFVISPCTEMTGRVGGRYGRTRTEGGPEEKRPQCGPRGRDANLQPHQGQVLRATFGML